MLSEVRVALGEPSFAALVVFHISVTFLGPHIGEAQIELLYVFVFTKIFYVVVQDDPPAFHHISVVGYSQRHACILFHQQDGDVLVFVDALDDLEDFRQKQRA